MTVIPHSKRASTQWASITPSNADRMEMHNCAWKAANNHKNTPAALMNVCFLMLWWLRVKISSKSIFGGGGGLVLTFCIIAQRVKRRTANYPVLTLVLNNACSEMLQRLGVRGSRRVMDPASSRCERQLWLWKLSWHSFTTDQFLILHYEARSLASASAGMSKSIERLSAPSSPGIHQEGPWITILPS